MRHPINRRQFIKYAALLTAAATLPACAQDPATDEALKIEPKPEIIALPEEFEAPDSTIEKNKNALYVRFSVALDEKGDPIMKDDKPVVLRDKDNNPMIDGYTTPLIKLQGDEEPRTYEISFKNPITLNDLKSGSPAIKIAMDPNTGRPITLATKNEVIEFRKQQMIAAINQQLAQQIKGTPFQGNEEQGYKIDVTAIEAAINKFTLLQEAAPPAIKAQSSAHAPHP